MTLRQVALLVALGVFLWIVFRAGRERELFVLAVRSGKTRLVRGKLPPSLFATLSDVMQAAKVERATVRVWREQDHARLEASGLNEWVLQRARNVLGTYPLAKLLSAQTLRAK
ncbi:MAG: DUF3634 family protein [Myxococcales bacterium]